MPLSDTALIKKLEGIKGGLIYWKAVALNKADQAERALLNIKLCRNQLAALKEDIGYMEDSDLHEKAAILFSELSNSSQEAIIAILFNAAKNAIQFASPDLINFLKSETFDCYSGIKGNIFQYLCLLETQPAAPKYPKEFYTAIFKVLVSLGVDINAKDSFFKQPPLCSAIGFDNNTAATALLDVAQEAKLDIDLAGSKAWHAATPLLLAVQRRNHPMVELLLNHGASINKANIHGLTPLHWAAIMLDQKSLEILLEHKADIQQKSLSGKTARDYLYLNLSNDAYIQAITDQLDFVPIQWDSITLFNPNTTANPELRPVIAHYWGDRDAFLGYLSAKITDENAREHCDKHLTRETAADQSMPHPE